MDERLPPAGRIVKRGPFTYLFGVAIAVYLGWVVLATDPMDRISRGCQPISWAGNLSVSIVAFLNPSWERSTQHFFDRGTYVCTYSVWRLIYGQAWANAHPGQQVPQEAPDKTDTSGVTTAGATK